ncbi:10 TM acyl transferase domain found in Cas1p-domain-containing protein [Peziza echinospora]|nr:10 TM acyl transferase domain found in Cas1p-domain-containing protein [Peziza echinospora]
MAVNRPPQGSSSPARPLFARVYLALLGLVAVAVIIRFCILDLSDPFKCRALISGGTWRDTPEPAGAGLPKLWQPKGCMLRKYKQKDVAGCLSGKRLVFAGDSTIRQVFWAVAQTLDGSVDPERGDKHSDQEVSMNGAKIEFIWDPWLNGSKLSAELEYFSNDAGPPALLLAGSGLWYAKYAEKAAWPAAQWKAAIDSIVKHMPPKPAQPRSSMLLLAPVPVPVWDKLSDDNKRLILPEEVGLMNEYLQELSIMTPSTGILWAFNEVMAGMPQAADGSGIHAVPAISKLKAELLLNLRCNAERAEVYPYDGTCCNTYAGPNYIQWLLLTAAFLLAWKAAGTSGLGSAAPESSATSTPSTTRLGLRLQSAFGRLRQALPRGKELNAILVFLLAVVYCFYTDRTQIFNKIHKHYKPHDFFVLTFIAILLAPLTTITATSDQPFLGRDQTDEWKGWMQIIILIYHYTGASKVAWIYDIVRLLVSSYLFMTGFGHTVFFITKGDYSLQRVASVLVRLNILSLVLPYMLRTDYLFYYFAPLVTFWFIVVYTTMRVGRRYNKNTKFLLIKILISAMVVTFVVKKEGILDTVFWALEGLARIHWDVKEWRFRVALDMWIVYVGMVSAVVFVTFTSSSSANSTTTSPHILQKLARPAVVASWVVLPTYIYLQTSSAPALFADKFAYNKAHPYISPLAILAFIVVRNSTKKLRNTHVKAYAWIGKISLETFTLQFHIWLAGDTKGVLDLGVFGEGGVGWWANFLVVTTVFLGVCWEVAGGMGGVVAWVVGSSGGGAAGQQKTQAGPRRPRLPVFPGSKGGDVEMGSLGKSAGGEAGEGVKAEGSGGEGGAGASPLQQKPGNLKLRLVIGFLILWILNLIFIDIDIDIDPDRQTDWHERARLIK